MRKHVFFVALAACLATELTGCPRSPMIESENDHEPPPEASLTWVEEDIEHGGATIAVGFRNLANAKRLEPIAAISRGGNPLASAMVFAQLVSADGKEAYGEEVATRYAPASEHTVALYEGRLMKPAGDAKFPGRATVRFRIVLPNSETDFQHDVPTP